MTGMEGDVLPSLAITATADFVAADRPPHGLRRHDTQPQTEDGDRARSGSAGALLCGSTGLEPALEASAGRPGDWPQVIFFCDILGDAAVEPEHD